MEMEMEMEMEVEMEMEMEIEMEMRIDALLGHFRKDFVGRCFSPSAFGPQFGVYGSFLPVEYHDPGSSPAPSSSPSSSSSCSSTTTTTTYSSTSNAAKNHQRAEDLVQEGARLSSSADRLKKQCHEGLDDVLDITEIYLNSGLKTLEGACMLERCCGYMGFSRPENKAQPIGTYVDAASVFQLCAGTYERCKKWEMVVVACKSAEVALCRAIKLARWEPWCVESVLAQAWHVDVASAASHRADEVFDFVRRRKVGGAVVARLKEVVEFESHEADLFVDLIRRTLKEIQGSCC